MYAQRVPDTSVQYLLLLRHFSIMGYSLREMHDALSHVDK